MKLRGFLKDAPKTEYRLFRGCNVYFSTSEEQLEAGEYESMYLLTQFTCFNRKFCDVHMLIVFKRLMNPEIISQRMFEKSFSR
jgi:hypothetical protein